MDFFECSIAFHRGDLFQKMTNILIWKVYLFQFLNPATVASYISYVTLVLLVTFRHAQFFTGDIFPSSLRGEHLVVRSHSLRCTYWYIFMNFCLVRISPLDKMGDVKTYRWLYCLADAQNCQCQRTVYFSIFCQFWRILWTLLKFALTVDQNVLPKRIYINNM